MTMTKARAAERDEALARLREILKPGDTIYTVLRHQSRSGMVRDIDAYVFRDNEPLWLSSYASKVLGWRMANDAVRVDGAGMDMGFHLVYALSATVFPDGFDCIGEGDSYATRCPSNDHSNDRGAKDYSPTRHHASGGYALKHRWLG